MGNVGDVGAVEREMARYYDAEEGREDRPLDPRRIAARDRFVAEATAGGRNETVLEIGTGPGRDSVALLDAGLRVVGVDLSRGHAARAGKRGVTMVVGSARSLPFATASIGGLWSMSTLMHVPGEAIEGTMREVARILAPGAPVAVGVWGGGDGEDFVDHPEVPAGPRRLFSRRSEARWRLLLELIGRIEDFDVWTYGDDEEFHYHLAYLRAHS